MARQKIRLIQNTVTLALFTVLTSAAPILAQPVICKPSSLDPCAGDAVCMDVWNITVRQDGQLKMDGGNITRAELKKDAMDWAKTGTWPIVVRGGTGAKYDQIISMVAMLKKAQVLTSVSCFASEGQ